jgi:peptide/nickel transport system permease protein
VENARLYRPSAARHHPRPGGGRRIFVFIMLRFTPGDPAAVIAGPAANAHFGHRGHPRPSSASTEPIWTQFAIWIGGMSCTGNFGESSSSRSTVSELIADRASSRRCALAMLHHRASPSVIAVPMGTMAAWTARARGSTALLMGFSVLGFSVPVFVIGYLLIWAGVDQAGLAAGAGLQAHRRGRGPWLYHLILPAITLSVIYIALIARVTRASGARDAERGLHPHRPRQGPARSEGADAPRAGATRRCPSSP